MEMHLVHWKKSYGSLSSAVNQPDGLAVLGFLFEIHPLGFDNLFFAEIINSLKHIKEAGKS